MGGDISFHHHFQTGSGIYPDSDSMGTKGFPPEVKQPGFNANQSSTSSSIIKKTGVMPALECLRS
jgi:hypothetical protein